MSQSIGFAGQLTPEHMVEVAEKGFKSVINNRPDFEEGNQQPTAESIGIAAEAAGLNYVIQPVVTALMNENDIRTFAENYNRLPKPVLAFCRTGNRCNMLYQNAVNMGLIEP